MTTDKKLTLKVKAFEKIADKIDKALLKMEDDGFANTRDVSRIFVRETNKLEKDLTAARKALDGLTIAVGGGNDALRRVMDRLEGLVGRFNSLDTPPEPTLDKKQLVQLDKATRMLTKLDKLVGAYKDDKDNKKLQSPMLVKNWPKDADKFDKGTVSVTESLLGLPQDEEPVQKVQTELDSLIGSWDAIKTNVQQILIDRTTLDAEWEGLLASNGHKQTQELIRVYSDQLASPLAFNLDFPYTRWLRHPFPAPFDDAVATIRQMPTMRNQIQEWMETYSKFDEGARGQILHQIRALQDHMKDRTDEMEKNMVMAPELLQKRLCQLHIEIADAFRRHESAVDMKQEYTGIDLMILDEASSAPVQTCREMRRYVGMLQAFYDAFEVPDLLQEMETVYSEAANRAASLTMKNKPPPVQHYAGKDLEELVTVVKDRFSNESVLGVFFDANWILVEQQRIEGNTIHKIKYSSLLGKVFMEAPEGCAGDDGNLVLERRVWVERDHMADDVLRVYGNFETYGDGNDEKKPPLHVLFPRRLLSDN